MNNRSVAGALLCCAAATFSATVAFAHAFLQTSSPAVGGTVRTPPAEVRIDFTEGIEPAFTSIVVTDTHGARVDEGGGYTKGGNTHFAVRLKALGSGIYHVAWKAVATDTHHTEGTFAFTVAP